MLWGFSARQMGLAVVFGVLCLVFGAIIYHETELRPEEPEAVPPAVAGDSEPPARALPQAGTSLPPVEAYKEVTQRPLFSSTRHPQAETTQQNSGKAGALSLVGTIITGNSRTALIRHGNSGALARLSEGQKVEGWTLQSIQTDRVTLLGGGTRQELKLKDQGPPPEGAALPPQGPAIAPQGGALEPQVPLLPQRRER